MRHIYTKYYWLDRLLAADPGRKRLHQAGKATLSLITSVFITLFLLRAIGVSLVPPAIVAGMVGLIGIMAVMDETKRQKKVTTLLMGAAALLGITLGSLLAGNAYFIGMLMVMITFSSFYFSRFGSRYFSMGMISFMTVYIASFLQLSSNQFHWFYLAIAIGTFNAYSFNFLLFKGSAHILRKSVRSFHIQANLTFRIMIELMNNLETNDKQLKRLDKNVRILNEYARNVSVDLNEHDVKEIWMGLETSQLRLYVFDATMLIETLAETIQKLKETDALELKELKHLLIWVIESLRDAKVLAQNYEPDHLKDASSAVEALRLILRDPLISESQSGRWFYLIRRIESIATHVVQGGSVIQQSLYENSHKSPVKEEVAEEDVSDKKETETGLKPSTKKAFQALIAGSIAIVAGYTISPIQPYWILLTVFLVLLGTESIGRIYMKGFQRSIGTVFGAVLGLAAARMLSNHSGIELVFLFLAVFLAFYLLNVSYTLMSLFITMLIAFLYDILLGGLSWQLMGARVVDTIAGAAIALGVSMVVFPKKTKDKVADSFEIYLQELRPYVKGYLQSFTTAINIKGFSNRAFQLDQKLHDIRDEARSLLQRRPGTFSHVDVAHSLTVFTAVNYYAKQLLASSYQKQFNYPEELEVVFTQVETKLDHNLEMLGKLMTGKEHTGTVYRLDREREQVERLVTNGPPSKKDLIHHLYYVWRINQSVVSLSMELGAGEK